LRMNLESTIKADYTWMRASRKGWHMDAVMPGQKPDEMIDIAVAIDTSGSIDEKMLKDFLSEIQGIMDSFPAFKLHVVSWDTEVYNPVVYTSENLDTMVDYVPAGGGGTDVNCVYNYLRDQEIEPRKLVVFTDGHFYGSDGDGDYCDTVWIIFHNPGFTATHGIWAHYEQETKE